MISSSVIRNCRVPVPNYFVLQSQKNSCPYCGEIIEVVVDLSIPEQQYIEDCSVCCRPIVFNVSADLEGGDARVILATEDE